MNRPSPFAGGHRYPLPPLGSLIRLNIRGYQERDRWQVVAFGGQGNEHCAYIQPLGAKMDPALMAWQWIEEEEVEA